MEAKALLDAGRLTEAIGELTQTLKAHPTDLTARIFLFEMLCFQGAFDRAAKQLDAIESQGRDEGARVAVRVYRDLLASEQARARVFHDGALPKFLFPPPAYLDRYIVLLNKLSTGQPDAVSLLAQAEEEAPAVGGSIGDRPFSALRDGDDRLAPVLEVFHGGAYVWLPFDQVRRIDITPPKRLRELLWVAARVETFDQSVGDVFVPALYVDSFAHANDLVRLGRLTEWQALDDQLVTGSGARVFLVDGREVPLLELSSVQFTTVAEAARS